MEDDGLLKNFGTFGKPSKKARSTKKRRRSGHKPSAVLTGQRGDHAIVVLAYTIKSGKSEQAVIAAAKQICREEAKRLAQGEQTLAKLKRVDLTDKPAQSGEESPAKSSRKKASR